MEKKPNVKILVCCHKQDVCATEPPYFPIQVGKAISQVDLGIQGDNTGDNISHKNASYCELTGMYWAWKNLKDVDVIGLCHYRRYFDFHGQCKPLIPSQDFAVSEMSEMNLSIPEEIIVDVLSGRIVTAKPFALLHNVAVNYCLNHVSDDLRQLQRVVKENLNNNYVKAFDSVMYRNHTLMACNMFVMLWSDFDLYCQWLFPLLEEAESRIDISHYNSVQRRIYGYMAERLFNVWLKANQKKVMTRPILRFCDNPGATIGSFHHLANYLRGGLATWMTRSHSEIL